jgi:exo-beta-1,3-glucanase (GH17 family)
MKKLHFAVATFSLALLATFGAASANASGSMSAPSSTGPDAYATGKSIFFKRVTCSSCPYSGRGKDAADAKSLRDQLNAADSKLKLDGDDRDALNTYLNSRFRLSSAPMEKSMDKNMTDKK